MFESTHSSSLIRRVVALTVVLGSSAFLGAQTQSTPAATQSPTLSQSAADTASYSSSASNSESDDTATPAPNALALNTTTPAPFLNAFQYGGGRRGAPRYRGGNTNPDGSNKWTAEAGVGFSAPVQDTSTYLKPSYAFGVGFGRQWSKHIAALLQFDWDNFGFQNSTLQNQTNLYNFEINQAYPGTCTSTVNTNCLSDLGGTSHIWSFTIDPTYTIKSGEGLGAYVVAGVGFYHKTANFTVPGTGEECDYYGECFEYTANETIDKYTSNAAGFNGGFGLTYKFSRFSSERLFGEVRYVYVANQSKPGLTAATVTSANYASTANDYPANSNKSYYFPVKFGIRF